ncbi:hypothetical protein [Ferrovibrio sp.]|uniref:hypothetical protein n=1 Tax=Ferrovibrio sp. TaxID=1917215 RepID=UPI0035AE9F34
MAQAPDPQNNRFEALYQRWQGRSKAGSKPGAFWRWFGVAVLALLVVEIGALAVVFGWYARQGALGQTYYDKFLLTRWFIAPWYFKHPAKEIPNVNYFGTATAYCTAIRWSKPDGLLGWRLRPASSYLKQPTAVFDQVGWRMVNPQGFASAGALDFTVPKEKPIGTYRIMLLGASSVEGDGAEGPLLNLPSQFHDVMRRRGILPPGGFERIEVVNAGVAAYRIGQEFLYFANDLVDYTPDLVLSYSGYVDFAYAWIGANRPSQKMQRIATARQLLHSQQLEAGLSPLAALANFASGVSREIGCMIEDTGTAFLATKVYERLSPRLPSLFGTEESDSTVRPRFSEEKIPEAVAMGSDAYSTGVRLIAAESGARNIRLALALQPALGLGSKPLTPVERETLQSLPMADVRFRNAYQKAGREILESFHRANPASCIIDASQPFDGVSERVWEDSRHLLGAGNRIVAELLVEKLIDCGWLRKP